MRHSPIVAFYVRWNVTRAGVLGLRGAVKFLSTQCVPHQFFDFVIGYPRVPRFSSPNRQSTSFTLP